MKKLAIVIPLFFVLFLSTFAHAGYILFYAGDFNSSDPNANALANENDAIVGGTPYGAATYQNFWVPSGHTWNITSMFTNNLANISPQGGYWELRREMSEGSGGTLIVSGYSSRGPGSFEWTPTGRNGIGYNEYQAHVENLNITVSGGQYWESVVPIAPNDYGRSFNSNTFNCFAFTCVGDEQDDKQFFNSTFFGANYTNANNEGAFQRFSSGIDGYDATPEPSSLVMLGSSVVGVGTLLRRRLVH